MENCLSDKIVSAFPGFLLLVTEPTCMYLLGHYTFPTSAHMAWAEVTQHLRPGQ